MAQYSDFIPENISPVGARRIGIYNRKGNRVGYIPPGNLARVDMGKKLYSFGALSDIHIGENTAEDDYKRALAWLSQNVDFICECGDLIHGGTDKAAEQIEKYKACRTSATVPVYAIAGNHDGAYVSDVGNAITSYTGQPLYYSVTKGNDVFIFVGNVTSNTGGLFTTAELQWLYETLEANRNKRCFLFQHVRPDDVCGNALGIYTYDVWGGTEQTVFESILRHYPNVLFFHGHSHLKFYMQKFSDLANYDNKYGCHSVHIPSISVPRDTTSVVNPSITTIYAESEGYVVDVYENGIHLRGRDFAKGEFLPIASYWLDTALQTVEDGTYIDPTGTLNTYIPSAYQRVEYIEATGTQYINTDIIPSNHMIEVKYSTDEYVDDTHLFGTALSWQWFHFSLHQNKYKFGLSGTQVTGPEWSAGVKTLLFNYGDNHEVIQDGVVLGSGKEIYSTERVTLCRRNVTKFYGKYYYFNITDRATGVLVRNMIPCYRKSDGEVGMYDTVSNQFFVNLGTGEFTKGADV